MIICCNGCVDFKIGMMILLDGCLFVDVVVVDFEFWFGREYLDKYGVDIKLLFKFLDVG